MQSPAVHSHRFALAVGSRNIAAIYNQAGGDYLAYADGDPDRLFCFTGFHGYADRHVWSLVERKLSDLRASGARSVTVLDAGCGPGTWLRRIVTYARQLGFSEIRARGFDAALAQVQIARRLADPLTKLARVELKFDVGDLLNPLSEEDVSVDITLCLYSVLSHLPVPELARIAKELARVTKGSFITTVRAVGSLPTAFVGTVEHARHLKLDHDQDKCEVEFYNGCRAALNFHLFTVRELQNLFCPWFNTETIRGLDIFHSRFAPDGRWNPATVACDERLSQELARLEEIYAADPVFIDRATHLLFLGSSKRAHASRKMRSP
jgi:SAM-dependent methyltransferase